MSCTCKLIKPHFTQIKLLHFHFPCAHLGSILTETNYLLLYSWQSLKKDKKNFSAHCITQWVALETSSYHIFPRFKFYTFLVVHFHLLCSLTNYPLLYRDPKKNCKQFSLQQCRLYNSMSCTCKLIIPYITQIKLLHIHFLRTTVHFPIGQFSPRSGALAISDFSWFSHFSSE